MDLIANYQKHIDDLTELKTVAEQLPLDMPNRRETILELSAKIRETEARIYKLQSIRSINKCDQCKKYLDDQEPFRQIGNHFTICEACVQTIGQVQLSSEWERIYGLPAGTIKQDIVNHKLKVYEDTGLVYKSGRYHLVAQFAVLDYYGSRRSLSIDASQE